MMSSVAIEAGSWMRVVNTNVTSTTRRSSRYIDVGHVTSYWISTIGCVRLRYLPLKR